MAACPACTFINADDATACEMCGASLGSAPPTGAQLGNESQFCFSGASTTVTTLDSEPCALEEGQCNRAPLDEVYCMCIACMYVFYIVYICIKNTAAYISWFVKRRPRKLSPSWQLGLVGYDFL